MGVGATMEDVLASRDDIPLERKEYLKEASGELTQLGGNPLAKIDFARAEAANTAMYTEKKGKPNVKREYLLKKLFLQYAKKYALKWDSVMNYPKQIKQKPAWFDLALSLFKDNEISQSDKKTIKVAFNQLWEFRDRVEPERVMPEEESLRQYGTNSPYYQQPEQSMSGLQQLPEDMVAPTDILSSSGGDYNMMTQPVESVEDTFRSPTPEGNTLGVRQIVPQEQGDYLSGYMSGFKSNVVDMTPLSHQPSVMKPQGEVPLGLTPSAKKTGGSGSGAFNIGREMFSSFRGGDSLKSVMTPNKPQLPSQPVQVTPNETITVAQQPQVMQRKRKLSVSVANRTTQKLSTGLSKFRNIELPSIPNRKMTSIKIKSNPALKSVKVKGSSTPIAPKLKLNGMGKINSSFSTIKSNNIKSSATFNKGSIGNMSNDIKTSVGGIVGGIKSLKQQARNEFRNKDTLHSINLKNLKSNKVKTNKDLNVLNKLKMETHSQVSREALECKMIPKLKSQCNKVFTDNHITNQVSKFRNEFKDVSKAVPTVRGEKARLVEVGMLGASITHGVDGAHVDDVKKMYRNSGTTKQMNIGMVDYDYSFATGKGGKKKLKVPSFEEEYYEDGEER